MTEGRLELHPNAEVIAVDLDTGRRIFEVRLNGPARLRHWYCAGKPILATAIAAAHDAGTVDLDGPVGLRASEVSAEAAARPAGWRCRLVDLLRHTADLHRLDVLTARLLAVPDLQAMCLDLLSTAQRTGPHGATYAPVAGWVLAAMELERASGRDYRDHLAEVVRGFGMADLVVATGLGRAELKARCDRVLPCVASIDGPDLVLLGEQMGEFVMGWNPAFGYVASVEAMSSFLIGFAKDLDGAGAVLTDRTATRLVTDVVDLETPGLGRLGAAGIGWLTDLGSHGFGRLWTAESFGSIGEGGCAVLAVDPVHRLALVAHFGQLLPLDEARRRVQQISHRAFVELGGTGS